MRRRGTVAATATQSFGAAGTVQELREDVELFATCSTAASESDSWLGLHFCVNV